MKNVIFLFLLLVSSTVFSANPSHNGLENPGPQMTFASLTVDYGIIKKGDEPLRKFTFQNTGTTPLVITGAKASCGCTVPSYPTEAIAPGATSQIEVRYDTKRVGVINKSITITSNSGEPVVLKITGEVVE